MNDNALYWHAFSAVPWLLVWQYPVASYCYIKLLLLFRSTNTITISLHLVTNASGWDLEWLWWWADKKHKGEMFKTALTFLLFRSKGWSPKAAFQVQQEWNLSGIRGGASLQSGGAGNTHPPVGITSHWYTSCLPKENPRKAFPPCSKVQVNNSMVSGWLMFVEGAFSFPRTPGEDEPFLLL